MILCNLIVLFKNFYLLIKKIFFFCDRERLMFVLYKYVYKYIKDLSVKKSYLCYWVFKCL